MPIRSLECRDVTLPAVFGFNQSLAAPCEAGPTENMNQEQICHESGMPTIAVGKEMDGDETMMEPGLPFAPWTLHLASDTRVIASIMFASL